MTNKLLHLTQTNLNPSQSYISPFIVCENQHYKIKITYRNSDYEEDKTNNKINMYNVTCIITVKDTFPKFYYNPHKDKFSIVINNNISDDKQLQQTTEILQTCRDTIDALKAIINEYFYEYADKTIDYSQPTKQELELQTLIDSGKIFELI